MATFSLAFGTATKNRDGKIIEAFFPHPVLAPADALVDSLAEVTGYQEGNQVIEVTASKSAQLAKAFETSGDSNNAAFAAKAAESEQPLVLVNRHHRAQSLLLNYVKQLLLNLPCPCRLHRCVPF